MMRSRATRARSRSESPLTTQASWASTTRPSRCAARMSWWATSIVRLPGEEDDPLGEDHDTAVPGLVHRYPDRVLFLTTGFCSTYCRYCTRSRMVGNPGGEYNFNVRNGSRRSPISRRTPRSATCCSRAATR